MPDHAHAQSGGSNLSETMWLKSEIAAIEAALNPTLLVEPQITATLAHRPVYRR